MFAKSMQQLGGMAAAADAQVEAVASAWRRPTWTNLPTYLATDQPTCPPFAWHPLKRCNCNCNAAAAAAAVCDLATYVGRVWQVAVAFAVDTAYIGFRCQWVYMCINI